MSRPNRIHAAWERYLRQVIPAGAPTVQIEESRRAFYAGAVSLLATIMNGVSGGVYQGEEPQPEDLAMMDDLQAELDEHIQDLRSQRPRGRL